MIATDLKRKADAESEAIDEQRHAESEHESPSKLPPPLDQTVVEDDMNFSDVNLVPPAHGTPEITPLKSTNNTSRDVTPQHISSPERFFTPTESAAPTPAKESQQTHAASNGSKTTTVNIPEGITEVPSVESTPTRAPAPQAPAAINPLVAANGPTEQPESAPTKPTGPATASAPAAAKAAAETPAPVTNNTPDTVTTKSAARAPDAVQTAAADAPLPVSAPAPVPAPVPSPAAATPASAPPTATAAKMDTKPSAPRPTPDEPPVAAPAAQTKEVASKPAVTKPAAPAPTPAPVRTSSPSPAPIKPTTVATNNHWSFQNIIAAVFGVAVTGGFVAYWYTNLRSRNAWK